MDVELYFQLRYALPKSLVNRILNLLFCKIDVQVYGTWVRILGYSFPVPETITRSPSFIIRIEDEPRLISTLQKVSNLNGVCWPSNRTLNQMLRVWMK